MKNGFTLTELLAVIIILSILMIIAIPTYNKVASDIKETNNDFKNKKILANTMLNYANKNLIDDIKPAGNNCSTSNCCKYYSIDYIIRNNIFTASNGTVKNAVTNDELTGYIKVSYDTSKYALVAEYVENENSVGNCEVIG